MTMTPSGFWSDLRAQTRKAGLRAGLPILGLALLPVAALLVWDFGLQPIDPRGLGDWLAVVGVTLAGLLAAVAVRLRSERHPAWRTDAVLALAALELWHAQPSWIAFGCIGYAIGGFLSDYSSSLHERGLGDAR